jgi:dienelactone hydrolase
VSEVVLFHHAQGLTSGVRDLAATLEDGGHTVHVPDLYDGRTFDDLESGLGYAREVGFGTVQARGVAAVEGMPEALVYAGISLGVTAAQQLAQTRAGARGAVFLESCLPASEFGDGWPDGVPVQIHGMDADPFFAEEGGDIDAARELVAATDQAELFLYPGDHHLFTDASLSTYDEAAARLVTERLLAFLARLS